MRFKVGDIIQHCSTFLQIMDINNDRYNVKCLKTFGDSIGGERYGERYNGIFEKTLEDYILYENVNQLKLKKLHKIGVIGVII